MSGTYGPSRFGVIDVICLNLIRIDRWSWSRSSKQPLLEREREGTGREASRGAQKTHGPVTASVRSIPVDHGYYVPLSGLSLTTEVITFHRFFHACRRRTCKFLKKSVARNNASEFFDGRQCGASNYSP